MLSARCVKILESGEPCGGYAITGSQFCFMHDPEKTGERAEARSKGGRARQDRVLWPDPEVRQTRVQELIDGGLKAQRVVLLGALADAEALENSVARARTIGYLLSVLNRLEDTLDSTLYDDIDLDDYLPMSFRPTEPSPQPPEE